MKKSIFSMAVMALLAMGMISACDEKPATNGAEGSSEKDAKENTTANTVVSLAQRVADSAYQKTASGLYYKFFRQTENEQPQVGELVDLRIFSVVNDTKPLTGPIDQTLLLEDSKFAGDFFEGLAMMHKGDSASFLVNIDSTFIKWFGYPSLPEEFKSTDVLRFEVRMDDFYPESEYPARFGAKLKKDMSARIEKMKSEHPDETAKAAQELSEYLNNNKIKAQPTESGLYYVMTKKGNGKKPEVGQMVKVHYTGKLLDGTVFDSSIDRGEPIDIPIGIGKVIPGWDEGIMMMSKGEKGVLYIPYYLGYGNQQAGDKITPYSNLIFEVELVDFQ